MQVPNWERGEEWAEMIQPRHHRMEILAFLNSVSTNGVLEADVVVVRSFDELETVDVRIVSGRSRPMLIFPGS